MPSLSRLACLPGLGNKQGMAPCKNCGDMLQILKGKAAPYTLPIGLWLNTLHDDFYENLVEGPHFIDPNDDFPRTCGKPDAHIHCLQCLTKIIDGYEQQQMNVPQVAYLKSLPKPVHWDTAVAMVREFTPEASEDPLSNPALCPC
ncbi:hypothetical protein TWF506_005738 [Arthrobotrys conoides]|uniref:Uncharacterized protein n=1 Tax=Arthrobotrys conoides TaxID=74498 RepID=A0AAN8PQ36_9PEZI